MHQCECCKREFKYLSVLKRHMNNIKPCSPKEEPRPESYDDFDAKLNCQWCCKHFSFSQNKLRHETTCKQRKDPVRHLEIKLGIPLYKHYTDECRFCHKNLSPAGLYKHVKVCKEKMKYYEKLNERNKQSGNCNVTYNNNSTMETP